MSKIPLDTFPTPHIDEQQRKALKSADMIARKQKHAEVISKQLQEGSSSGGMPLFVLPAIPEDANITMQTPRLTVTHTMYVQIKTHTDYSDTGEMKIPITKALPHMSEYTRSILVEQLLPMCKDTLTNHDKILVELPDRDKSMCTACFETISSPNIRSLE